MFKIGLLYTTLEKRSLSEHIYLRNKFRHAPSRTAAQLLLSHFASLASSLIEMPAIWTIAFLQREQGIQNKPVVATRHGSLNISQIPITEPHCCMVFHSLAERTLFAILALSTRIYRSRTHASPRAHSSGNQTS
jgi:hypothetical protein